MKLRRSEKYNIAVVGATGNAGMKTLQILAERNFPVNDMVAVASEMSVGKAVSFREKIIKVQRFSDVDFSKIDIAFFCAGSGFSRNNAKSVADMGCVVIDKSSYFRLNPKVPLIVPEINRDILKKDISVGIISTPNCVAVPLSMTLKALSEVSQISRVVVSTYQSVSGAGHRGIDELYNQTKSFFSVGAMKNEVFPKKIAFNIIPVIGDIYDSGITDEEDKISGEIRKILKLDIKIAVTCVRVPTFIGHAMSVACEFDKQITEKEVYKSLSNFQGIAVIDKRDEEVSFVTPTDVQGEDAVYVSRIRKDPSVKYGFLYWIVTDNLRKGAALNSVQIAEELLND